MITRLEIIDDTGRTVIVSLKDKKVVLPDLQDDGRTLKIFIRDIEVKDE